jgi:hypothetical protein
VIAVLAQQVGAFDFTLAWNPTVLALSASAFDIYLDGPGQRLQSATPRAASINLAASSFRSVDSASWAYLVPTRVRHFRGYRCRHVGHCFGPALLSDFFGDPLACQF